jgi:hypothetical protein
MCNVYILPDNTVMFWGLCITYKRSFGLDDWIYCTLYYIHTVRYYRSYSTNAILHIQFIVTHALGFSVFTSRILATDLSQSHWHFKSHMKFSLHRLIPFSPSFCDCQFRRLDCIQFLCSQAHITAGWRLEARPFTSDSASTTSLFLL